MAGKIRNHAEEKYGRLTVKRFLYRKNNATYWECFCDCGSVVIVDIHSIIKGDTKSCGCWKKEYDKKKGLKHGDAKRGKHTRLYRIWVGMRLRCDVNSKRKDYKKYYSKKGIKVCDEWQNNYSSFKAWALKSGYKDGLSIERKNNKEGYSPNNCKWETPKAQAQNTKRNVMITYNGEKKCYAEWARLIGINPSTFRYRVLRGWPEEKLFSKIHYVKTIGNLK